MSDQTMERIADALEHSNQLAIRTAQLLEEDARRRIVAERRESWRKSQAKARAALAAEHKPLSRFRGIGLLNAIPGLGAKFDKQVPDGYLSDAHPEVIVACPCDEKPTLLVGQVDNCDCGRWYARDSEAVYVYRPMEADDGEVEQTAVVRAIRDEAEGPRAAAA